MANIHDTDIKTLQKTLLVYDMYLFLSEDLPKEF
jgi:hypothetical protein